MITVTGYLSFFFRKGLSRTPPPYLARMSRSPRRQTGRPCLSPPVEVALLTFVAAANQGAKTGRGGGSTSEDRGGLHPTMKP